MYVVQSTPLAAQQPERLNATDKPSDKILYCNETAR